MKSGKVKIFFNETNINFFAWSGVYCGFLFSPYVRRFISDSLSSCATRIENDHGFWGVDLKKWYELGKKVRSKLDRETLESEQNLISLEAIGTKLLSHADKITGKKLAKIRNKELILWLNQAWKDNLDLNGIGFLAVVSDFEHNYLSTALANILEKRSQPGRPTQAYLAKLISSDRPDLNWIEYLELLKIVKKYKVLKKINKSIEFKRHIGKYNWLNYGFQGPVWEEKDFVERIKKILSGKPVEQEYFEHLNHFRNLKQEQAGLEELFKLTKHERYLFKCARNFMFSKAYRVNVRHKIQYAFDLVFTELGKRFFLPIYFFRYAQLEEITDLIKGKNIDTARIIKRRQLMLEIIDNGKKKFVPTKQIGKVYQKLLIKEKKISGSVLHGHTAYSGKAQGRAKLIFSLSDLPKVKKGDILITISTTPDLLPAMIRAKAFVTDQGGITSHAAIVAREMKKPCVIGTKFATKIFKDGDLVEVDANKGIVRKI